MLKYLWWDKKPFPSYSLFADHMVSVHVLLGKKGEERKRGVDCGISSISKAEENTNNYNYVIWYFCVLFCIILAAEHCKGEALAILIHGKQVSSFH